MNHELDRIAIASPCTADWNAMKGDDRKRFCSQCKLHVHDLSAMSRDEASTLLAAAAKGRVCVRFFRRADGRVLTQDCPVGLRARLRWAWARTCAATLALWAFATGCAPKADATPQPVKMGEAVMPTPKPPRAEMGDMVAPPIMGKVVARPEPKGVEPAPTNTPPVEPKKQ